jgi:hypothetical protein
MAESTDIYARVFLGADQGSQAPGEQITRLNDSDDAEERAQKVLRDLASSESTYQAFIGSAKEDNRFYAGHQWDDIDRMAMERTKRPAIVFNMIKPAVDAVSGLERLNRSDVRFVSRAMDSPPQLDAAGDLASEAVSTADDLCNASEELSRVARDAVVTGMGWSEIRMDYSDDINGRVIYERLPWDEMRWDPNNQKKENLEGREWCARKKPISRKKFKQIWGEEKLASVDLSTPDTPFGATDKYELVTPYYSRANQQANPQVGGGGPKKDVTVVQYQWRDMQPVFRLIDETTGEENQFDEVQWGRLKKRAKMLGTPPPPAVKQMQPVFRQGMYCRGIELEEPVDLPGGFSLLCMTGQWDEEKKRWYGLVRNMIDPQKTQNKAISSALAFHISNAKGGVLFKPRAFDDPRRAQDAWSQPDAWIPVTDESDIKNDIVPRTPTQLPPELPMFYSEAQKAMTLVSGVNAELIGQATGQTPSQTAQGRTQAGLVVLGWFFDNLRRHHKEKATMTLEFIREYWSQGQIIQVGGDFNSQSAPLLKESLPDRWHYSLVLDDSVKHNPNLKAAVWRDLMESGILQALMKFGMGQMILQLLKYSPFPSQLVTDIQKQAAQMQQQQKGQPQKGRGKQDPPELVQANVQLRSAQAKKAMSQAREIDMRSNLTGPKFALEAVSQGQKGQYEQHQMEQERLKNAHQRGKDVADLMHKGHQHKLNITNALAKGMGAFGGFGGPAPQPPPGAQDQGGEV